MKDDGVLDDRSNKVRKSNELIRKARTDLTSGELKALAFVFSKIKLTDTMNQWYSFSIPEYCRVCGIDATAGKNYNAVKDHITKLLNEPSFWMLKDDGNETSCRWLDKARMNKMSGNVAVRLDEDIQQYVIGMIKGNYTEYELLSILPMKSSYSIRMYEILRSWEYRGGCVFQLEELKHVLFADNYTVWRDFKRRVLDVSVKEINMYSDISVSYEPIREGRTYKQLRFRIHKRGSKAWDIIAAADNALLDKENEQVKGQMSLSDYADLSKWTTGDDNNQE